MRIKSGSVVLYIGTLGGSILTICSTAPDSTCPMTIEPGDGFVDCDFPRLLLSAGSFAIGAGLAIPNMEWLYNQPHAATFDVYARDTFNSGLAPASARYPVAMEHFWRVSTRGEISNQSAGQEVLQLPAR
jgi:hypothetical protein